MLKGIAQGADGRQMLILGLTRQNVQRMEAGRPILVDQRQLAELGYDDVPDQQVVIFFGETQNDLTQQLRDLGLNAPDVPEPKPGESFYVRGQQPPQP